MARALINASAGADTARVALRYGAMSQGDSKDTIRYEISIRVFEHIIRCRKGGTITTQSSENVSRSGCQESCG